MKKWLTLLSLLAGYNAMAQLYYTDFWSVQQTQQQMKVWQKAGVTQLIGNSFNSNQLPLSGLLLMQNAKSDYRWLQTKTADEVIGNSSLITHFNESNQVIKTIDSTTTSNSETQFRYNNMGALEAVFNEVKFSGFNNRQTEQHLYQYQGKQLSGGWFIKNKKDSFEVKFLYDQSGNLIEEQRLRFGKQVEKYLYYYDAKGHLSDVVVFDKKLKKLLPLFMMSYNDKGELISQTKRAVGSTQYLRWDITYDERGLKQREDGFGKQQTRAGSVRYRYE